MRLMCAPDVVVEDVGAGPVCGCSQKIQTIQLSELPSRSAMVRATPEDAVGHDIAFSTKIYCVYKIYYENMTNMETTIKRKNIDLPVDVLQKLSLMAVAQGRSLKAYIEQLLIAKANSITIEVRENPSPSGDKWFDDAENMESVRRGIQEMDDGQGKAYTIDEIRERLGL